MTPEQAVRRDFENYRRLVEAAEGGQGVYDRAVMDQMQVERVEELDGGRVRAVFRLRAADSLTNLMGAVHGGAVATAVDVATSFAASGLVMALRGEDATRSVSVSLSVNFARPVVAGSVVRFDCVAHTAGRRILQTTCRISDERGRTLGTATHAKAVVAASL
jgi:acyl-coenzyme A thioesterase 13